MRKLSGLLLCMFLLFSLFGCQDEKAEKKLIEKPSLLLPNIGYSTKPAMLTVNSQALLLLGSQKGVVLYTIGKELVISPDPAGNQWLHYDGKNLYAFWWIADQNKAKSLKVAVSSDGGQSFSSPTILNSNTGVLPDISIASDGNGHIAVAYTDEREPGYGVYINTSNDSGKTWDTKDNRLDTPVITPAMMQEGNLKPETFANSPKLAFINERLVAVWQQVDMAQMTAGHSLRIVSKISSDAGRTWGSESNVFAAPNMQPVEMAMFSNNKEMYIFAMLTDSDKGFTGFYNKDDSFSVWGEISNSTLGKGFNKQLISWIKGAFSGENLTLAFTSEPTEAGGKVHAEVATLSTLSHNWLGQSKILDSDKGHDLTKSTYPDIIDTGTAGLHVVWEDYRTLAPSIYIDISKDHGATWLPKPIALTSPGLTVSKDPKLLVDDKQLWLAYFMVQLNGQNPSGQRVYQKFIKEDNTFKFPDINTPSLTAEELKKRLIERANKLWVLREERKWDETWDYMDPVYRERFDKDEWLKQQGKINFSKTAVDESSVKVTGNIGILDANVDVSIPQQVAKEGLLESAPPKTQKVGMRWGWFYNDWYFMPKVIFGEHMEY
ncbi:sialidase family protein [uncultured Thiothrix sp.]|uniref:sialidase family protein n=1 Tax=uncultured Thiothrix sp. TaxID=223185 RepID=UPI00262C37F4|nr:sialidase family protein [uncultured Thiothrix sp.]